MESRGYICYHFNLNSGLKISRGISFSRIIYHVRAMWMAGDRHHFDYKWVQVGITFSFTECWCHCGSIMHVYGLTPQLLIYAKEDIDFDLMVDI
ncbi:unnamed protein product [Lactuca virosa]|uniref:Uncharacterized protein n=1 Tax=Lactuca virosa TaxID=75947 RepID=A0AAU9N388_9ASTR|nr:unnamed protein product [Lactuca virosa]